MEKPFVRQATADEIKNWDSLLQKNPDGGEILQSTAMAQVKESTGWVIEYWVYELSSGNVYATALVRNFPMVRKLAYITRGPGVITDKDLDEIVTANKSVDGIFAIKMEPLLKLGDKVPKELIKVPNVQSIASTIVIDLSASQDEILASFRQRARREIRAGEKDGMDVIDADVTDENCDKMFDLYSTTAQRAGVRIRPKSYFVNFWKTFAKSDQGRFFFVRDTDKNILAGAFVARFGHKAIYKDGGSIRGAKHFSHLLQWEIMKWLKSNGVTEYDLDGTPPSDRADDPQHPYSTLLPFKSSFGAPIVDFVGAYDQVLDAKKYRLWTKYVSRILRKIYRHTARREIY